MLKACVLAQTSSGACSTLSGTHASAGICEVHAMVTHTIERRAQSRHGGAPLAYHVTWELASGRIPSSSLVPLFLVWLGFTVVTWHSLLSVIYSMTAVNIRKSTPQFAGNAMRFMSILIPICHLQLSRSAECQDVLKFITEWAGGAPNLSYSFQ